MRVSTQSSLFEKKILPPLLPGFELATFQSRVRRSTNKLSRLQTNHTSNHTKPAYGNIWTCPTFSGHPASSRWVPCNFCTGVPHRGSAISQTFLPSLLVVSFSIIIVTNPVCAFVTTSAEDGDFQRLSNGGWGDVCT